jgi:hypothetical protein
MLHYLGGERGHILVRYPLIQRTSDFALLRVRSKTTTSPPGAFTLKPSNFCIRVYIFATDTHGLRINMHAAQFEENSDILPSPVVYLYWVYRLIIVC